MPFPVDEKYILLAEKKLGMKFPESFRKKMMQDNGGEAEISHDVYQLYPFMDASDNKRLKRTCNDIIRETTSAKECRSFPKDAVAIGSSGNGDQLVFMLSEVPGILQDAVYWWDHETGAVNKIADDFSELI